MWVKDSNAQLDLSVMIVSCLVIMLLAAITAIYRANLQFLLLLLFVVVVLKINNAVIAIDNTKTNNKKQGKKDPNGQN